MEDLLETKKMRYIVPYIEYVKKVMEERKIAHKAAKELKLAEKVAKKAKKNSKE